MKDLWGGDWGGVGWRGEGTVPAIRKDKNEKVAPTLGHPVTVGPLNME